MLAKAAETLIALTERLRSAGTGSSVVQRAVLCIVRGYVFLTSKATAVRAPQESLFRVKGGKAWRFEESLTLLISSQVTVLLRPFFMQMGFHQMLCRKTSLSYVS